MTAQFLNEAMLGYTNSESPCPFLWSSNSWSAWQIGSWMKRTGRGMPRDCRPSRGYTFHINDMKVLFTYKKAGGFDIERIN